MIGIKVVIQTIVDKLSYMAGYKKAWLEKHWVELVGEETGKHSRPFKIEKDILFVSVDSSVWNQEIFMKRANLINIINQKFAHKIVEDVKCQMGHVTSREGIERADTELLSSVTSHGKKRDQRRNANVMNCLQRKKKVIITKDRLN